MEKNDLNRSISEELFEGKLEVTVVPDWLNCAEMHFYD